MENKDTEKIKEMSIWGKIGAVQDEVGTLIRDEKNKFQNYSYFDEAQILKILKPLLGKYELTLIISDDADQPFIHEREGTNHFLKYLKQMVIIDPKSCQSQIFKFWACGSNSDLAKAKGSAETYAMKYILSKFFLIRVLDENDPELKKPEEEKKGVPNWLKDNDINQKAILRKDEKGEAWWYCRKCANDKTKAPFKLIKDFPLISKEAIIRALTNHGEIEPKK